MNGSRGEIWLVDLDPVAGHEQGRTRPALVISATWFNTCGAGLAVVVPITSTHQKYSNPLRIKILRGQGGLSMDSWILCDQVRTLSHERFIKPYESVEPAVMAKVEEALRLVLEL